ncbi:MAG: tRNA dihydrouridine synthase DusB [Ruminococcaceae bacterium]|nr:tRNA dihydrouridine synthase DusB [Oscillospiraceae bacterium]
MKIGNFEINGYAALAPMAGVADRACRELCIEFGAAYVVTEMVSSKGLTMHDRKSDTLMVLGETEKPAAVQIFGCDPATMAEAAKKAAATGCAAVDINMGCPAPKIAGNGGGSALMKDPDLAARITEAVVKAIDLPVTVKFRSGWDENSINAVEFAGLQESAGAAAITVHGRTRKQMYAPPVNLDIIKQVKQAVKIPVIGNGDITDPISAENMYKTTGCDFIMVGRGALGAPWVFTQINEYLKSGILLPDPPVEKRMEIMIRHISKLCEYKGDYVGMREARKHSGWYIKGVRGAASLRQEIGSLENMDQLRAIAEKVINADRC